MEEILTSHHPTSPLSGGDCCQEDQQREYKWYTVYHTELKDKGCQWAQETMVERLIGPRRLARVTDRQDRLVAVPRRASAHDNYGFQEQDPTLFQLWVASQPTKLSTQVFRMLQTILKFGSCRFCLTVSVFLWFLLFHDRCSHTR
ncbi:hypothetical protein Mapa_004283 [Marchantia paleacea]|nr:hypothetical protein Mapa_004283 [Marchantia paleacea]